MYLPRYHQAPSEAALLSLIDTHALGAWVCHTPDGLVANHVPFVLDRSRGPQGRLIGHVARANPVWRALAAGLPSVVLFQGPQAYITPAWYPGHAAHGCVVPTWNYAVAHVHGQARAVQERGWLLDMLARVTAAQEAGRTQPWQMADAPADFMERLLRAIVGIEISIERIEGKLKASQDEDRADRQGTVQGLRATPDPQAQAMADLVQQALQAEGDATT